MRSVVTYDACRLIVGVFIVALVMHTWLVMGVVVPVTVSGDSMAPTLSGPQRLFVDRTAFTFRSPRRWEIVVFRCPDDASQFCVKRVVGLPGETVALAGGQVWINGQRVRKPLDADYEVRPSDRPDESAHSGGDGGQPAGVWRLGPSEFFVLGDNPAASDDSRSWFAGPGLDAKLLVGKPLGVR